MNETKQELNKLCPVCIQGKIKQKQFLKASNTRESKVLEIIHSDVVEKIFHHHWVVPITLLHSQMTSLSVQQYIP